MDKNHTYIIIDDEVKAINLLQKAILAHCDTLTCVGTYSSSSDAFDALRNGQFDLVFLDISMPQKTGIKLLELVPNLDCEIIFVTAHEEHALTAFNFSPTGYILKPINHGKLITAINKAIKHIEDKRTAEKIAAEKVLHLKGKIGVRNSKGLDYVDVNDILFLNAVSRYTKIITTNREYTSSNNIGKFKFVVEQYGFYQVHRSYIINIKRVKRYESNGIVFMEGDYEIPVAKSSRDSFLHLFERV